MAKGPSPENRALAREASEKLRQQAAILPYTVSKHPPLSETTGIAKLTREAKIEKKHLTYNRRLRGESDDSKNS